MKNLKISFSFSNIILYVYFFQIRLDLYAIFFVFINSFCETENLDNKSRKKWLNRFLFFYKRIINLFHKNNGPIFCGLNALGTSSKKKKKLYLNLFLNLYFPQVFLIVLLFCFLFVCLFFVIGFFFCIFFFRSFWKLFQTVDKSHELRFIFLLIIVIICLIWTCLIWPLPWTLS